MTLSQEIESLASELNLFDDVMDKYEYIIELGKALEGLEEKYKTELYLVQGCQSHVWLHAFTKGGLVYFEADGNALIAKGLIAMLIRIFSKRSAEEILASSSSDLEVLGLSEIISAGRQNGIASMLGRIYDFAKGVKDDE